MKDFLKALILVTILFLLLLFSAPYLKDNNLQNWPGLNKTFQALNAFLDYFNWDRIKKIDWPRLKKEPIPEENNLEEFEDEFFTNGV